MLNGAEMLSKIRALKGTSFVEGDPISKQYLKMAEYVRDTPLPAPVRTLWAGTGHSVPALAWTPGTGEPEVGAALQLPFGHSLHRGAKCSHVAAVVQGINWCRGSASGVY